MCYLGLVLWHFRNSLLVVDRTMRASLVREVCLYVTLGSSGWRSIVGVHLFLGLKHLLNGRFLLMGSHVYMDLLSI